MKYFLDTEFSERPCTIELISLGIVAEDGREFYAVSNDFNESGADSWIKENVLPNLWDGLCGSRAEIVRGSRSEIAEQILKFIGTDETPEFIGWCCAHDWVVFLWLWGSLVNRPYGFPYYCYDVEQAMARLGIKPLPQRHGQHNALQDARWIRDNYVHLACLCDRKISITKSTYESMRRKINSCIANVFIVENCDEIPINTPGFDQRGNTAYRERLGKCLDERVRKSIAQEKKASG